MEGMKIIRCNSDGSIVIKNMNDHVTVIGRSMALTDNKLDMHKYDNENNHIEHLIETIEHPFEVKELEIEIDN